MPDADLGSSRVHAQVNTLTDPHTIGIGVQLLSRGQLQQKSRKRLHGPEREEGQEGWQGRPLMKRGRTQVPSSRPWGSRRSWDGWVQEGQRILIHSLSASCCCVEPTRCARSKTGSSQGPRVLLTLQSETTRKKSALPHNPVYKRNHSRIQMITGNWKSLLKIRASPPSPV